MTTKDEPLLQVMKFVAESENTDINSMKLDVIALCFELLGVEVTC